MSTLNFELKTVPEFELDISPITADKIASYSTLDQIKKIKLHHSGRGIPISTFFHVSGKKSDHIKIKNSHPKLIRAGQNMHWGKLEIDGTIGMYAGLNLHGGHIIIHGNANDCIGNNMTGGRIDILGDADSYIGCGLPGTGAGMTNGLIRIMGNAGDKIGDRMRRGTIIVQGNAGRHCASRMKAGTIIVFGEIKEQPAIGMVRGTLVLAKPPNRLPTTFLGGELCENYFLRLLLNQLAKLDKKMSYLKKHSTFARRYIGDLAYDGRGEIIVLE